MPDNDAYQVTHVSIDQPGPQAGHISEKTGASSAFKTPTDAVGSC